jgi:DNA repair exonuclease SbcCD ATPase subunit
VINFKRIRFKNFLSIGDDFTEIQLDKSPTTLISGWNGMGKSVILDALSFVLFGVPFRNINVPQLVNDTNENDMLVEIELQLGRKNYKVRRGLKPRIFEIYENDVLIDQESRARDYQKYLEQSILKLNKKSFNQVVILGSASYVPFMQLTTAERRYIIEDLLDIQIFSAMNVALKARIVELKDTYISLSNGIELQNEKIALVRSYLKKLKSDNVTAIADKRKLIGQNRNQIKKEDSEISQLIREITDYLTEITDHISIQEQIRKLESSEEKIRSNKNKAEKEKKFYQETNDCPTCKQAIDNIFKNFMVKNKTSLVKELESALIKLEKDLGKSENRLTEIKGILKIVDERNKEIGILESSIRSVESFIVKVDEEIQELQEKSGSTKEQEDKLKSLQVELDELTLQRDNIITRKHRLDIVSVMLKDSGIKTKIIRQYIPIINKYVNKYLAEMDFFANFTLDENFKEIIHIRGSKERTYYQLSEGQKLRIDLSLLFTWRAISKLKNSADTNLLVMDEIFEASLDSGGIEDLLKLLQNLSQNTNIFVISPQGDLLIDKFSNNIKFIMENGFSVIEQ